MKYILLFVLIFCLYTSVYPSEFFKKHAPSIITTSAVVITGTVTTYYYWLVSSQINDLIDQQKEQKKQLEEISANLSQLQECTDKISASVDRIETLRVQIEGRSGARRNGTLFKNNSFKSRKE